VFVARGAERGTHSRGDGAAGAEDFRNSRGHRGWYENRGMRGTKSGGRELECCNRRAAGQ
jgi:hypothetical protein